MPTIWTFDGHGQRKEFEAEPFYGFLLFNRQRYPDEIYQNNYPYELFTPDGLVAIMDFETLEEAKDAATTEIDLIPATPIKVLHSAVNEYIGQIGKAFCYSQVTGHYLVALEQKTELTVIGWYLEKSLELNSI